MFLQFLLVTSSGQYWSRVTWVEDYLAAGLSCSKLLRIDDTGGCMMENLCNRSAWYYCNVTVDLLSTWKVEGPLGSQLVRNIQQEVPPPPPPHSCPFVLMKPLGGSGKPWNWKRSIPSKPPPPLQSQRAWTKPCSASCTLTRHHDNCKQDGTGSCWKRGYDFNRCHDTLATETLGSLVSL